MSRVLDRRQLLRGAAVAGSGIAFSAYMPAWAQPVSGGIVKPLPVVSGTEIALTIDSFPLIIDGKRTPAIGVNGTVPAPLIRLKEGQNVRLAVSNKLDVDSSIPSPTTSRSGRPAHTGITAIPARRSRRGFTARS
jgi:FtsP/CotA-like multicopper oxidase with cupredoxin domain